MGSTGPCRLVVMTSAYGIEAEQSRGGAPKVGSSSPPGSLLQGGGATKVLRLQLCLASALCDQCALPSSTGPCRALPADILLVTRPSGIFKALQRPSHLVTGPCRALPEDINLN